MEKMYLTKEEIKEHIKKYPIPKGLKRKKRKKKSFYTAEWKYLRAKVINKYGAICMRCGSCQQINVDHIKPKSKYPDLAFDINNLQVLCWPCNKSKSFLDETDYRRVLAIPA